MYEDRFVQPRQIYASTVTRRDRRWTRRRGRGRGLTGLTLVSAAALLAALTVIATLAPSLS
jgi:Flp pilus assembly protein TadB